LNREFEAIPGYHLKPSKQSQINRLFAIKPIEIAIEMRAGAKGRNDEWSRFCKIGNQSEKHDQNP